MIVYLLFFLILNDDVRICHADLILKIVSSITPCTHLRLPCTGRYFCSQCYRIRHKNVFTYVQQNVRIIISNDLLFIISNFLVLGTSKLFRFDVYNGSAIGDRKSIIG